MTNVSQKRRAITHFSIFALWVLCDRSQGSDQGSQVDLEELQKWVNVSCKKIPSNHKLLDVLIGRAPQERKSAYLPYKIEFSAQAIFGMGRRWHEKRDRNRHSLPEVLFWWIYDRARFKQPFR